MLFFLFVQVLKRFHPLSLEAELLHPCDLPQKYAIFSHFSAKVLRLFSDALRTRERLRVKGLHPGTVHILFELTVCWSIGIGQTN